MSATVYQYSISNDFAAAVSGVNSNSLTSEIRSSAITIALDHIDTYGDNCDIWFKDSLSLEEDAILDAIVAAHTGASSPDDLLVPGAFVRQGFYPDFRGYADYSVVKGVQVDPLYNLSVRGAITTDEGSFRDDFDQDLVKTLTGTVTFVNGSTRVSGMSTAFMSELQSYRQVKLSSDGVEYFMEVCDVFSDTEAELCEPYEGTSGTGTAHYADWVTEEIGDATVTKDSTEVLLNSGVESGSVCSITRSGDYLPMAFGFHARITERRADQTIQFGAISEDGTAFAMFEFSGTNNTEVTLRTSNNGVEIQEEIVTLPGGRNTDSSNYWQVDITLTKVAFYCEEAQLTVMNVHIPAPYQDMNCVARIENTGSVLSGSTLAVDVALLSNYNKVEIKNSTRGEPLPIMIREETHTVYGKLTSTATTADQEIVEYEVPEAKTCYIIGFRVENESESIKGRVKLGRNDVSTEPAAPGSLDPNINRSILLKPETSFAEEWGSCPRFVGMGGDTIKITVTPSAATETNWRASLDLILR